MTRNTLLMSALLVLAASLSGAQEPIISGNTSASFFGAAGAAESPDYLYGTELYANLRLEADAGTNAVFYTAVNFIAASGAKALPLYGDYLVLGQLLSSGLDPEAAVTAEELFPVNSYVSLIELERLYMGIQSEYTDTDLGLMRMAFGYGQAFSPTDFLNPPNPLVPDARPKGIIGANITAYPAFDSTVQVFAVMPRDALNLEGEAALFGAAIDKHWSRASLQALYVYQVPDDARDLGLHRVGTSLKLDLEAALVLETLFTQDLEEGTDFDNLDFALGLDYSFIDGKLYTLVQYLHNASNTGLSKDQFLFAQGMYSYSDFTRFGASCLFSLDDHSFTPALLWEHDPYQALSISLTGRIYADRNSLGIGRGNGELGPERNKMQGSVDVAAKLRF